jgi:hypothetical protein
VTIVEVDELSAREDAMLTTFEVAIYIVALVILVPMILYSLITGKGVPESSWFAKYYRAERYLLLAGNLFLLAVCASAVARLGRHFGYIDASASDRLSIPLGVAFGVTLLASLVLWIRAAVKVRRDGRTVA